MELHFIPKNDLKNMSNGMRDNRRTPLTEDEIRLIKSEIRRIEADESIFVFNDSEHINDSTCYNFIDDKIYVTRNVLPDTRYASIHPRDLLSVAAVLAHEYYGHRPYRQEYLDDRNREPGFHTTPEWQDECRASINAAKITPGLERFERSNLIMEATFRAQEYSQLIEMDEAMKEIVYGYRSDEKNITYSITPITYVDQTGQKRTQPVCGHKCAMPEVRRKTQKDDYRGR